MNKKLLSLTLLSLYCISSYAQIGIGTTNPDASSVLDIKSTTKGFLPPRINNPNSDISNPATGLLVYSLADECLKVNKGTPSSPQWECLSGSGGSVTPTTPVNPSLTSDCSGVFTNTSSYGINSYHTGALSPTYSKFDFHLSEDGSKIYNNYGHYYDTNTTVHVNHQFGSLQMTTQANVINQIFPGKSWKDFLVVDGNTNVAGTIFLLSKDGELHSTVLSEAIINQEYHGYSTSSIDPNDDDDFLRDPSNNNNDYRFTPYSHIVNDSDPSIKFSSLHYSLPTRTGGALEISLFPYDGTNKKFYSFGARKDANQTKYLISGNNLCRTTTPTTLKESLTIKEADLLNNVISHFGTEFDESTDNSVKFHAQYLSGGINFNFITKDGYYNILIGNNRIYRIPLPAGVNVKSILGYYISPVLGDDGNLYKIANNLYNSDYNTSTINVAGNGNMTLYEPNYTIPLHASGSDMHNLTLKDAYLSVRSQSINALDTDGKLYEINYVNGTITNNYHQDYNVPLVSEILSSHYDMVVKDLNGVVFVTSSTSSLRQDFPLFPLANSAVGHNGAPHTDMANNRVRLLFNCFGN